MVDIQFPECNSDKDRKNNKVDIETCYLFPLKMTH